MSEESEERARPEPVPGSWPTRSFQNEYLQHSGPVSPDDAITHGIIQNTTTERSFPLSHTTTTTTSTNHGEGSPSHFAFERTAQDDSTVLRTGSEPSSGPDSEVTLKSTSATGKERKNIAPDEQSSTASTSSEEDAIEAGNFEPIKSQPNRPKLGKTASRPQTEEDAYRTLSKKWTRESGRQGSYAKSTEGQEEQEEIQRLMSRMFGQTRKAQSEDEKTRHVGVIWKHLTVKGIGLGAALQPTITDPFLGPFRLVSDVFSRSRSAIGKPPVRTILNDFNGCVRPGEMLLVLGRPGAGCSTFLKMFGNQRFGYKEISGDVTYGGTSAEKMAKDFRGEVLYNPEDDLHYATLSVKNTLQFALTTKTPGKASRNDGETRSQYVKEFLRVVTKLFWIEHTLNTKVGNELVRGVSGGEKKRVSIAEAMITKASSQAWDNSTRGLDASTALEYVQAIRSLTNMAQVSTAVALYQAGESLYELFDKVGVSDFLD